MDTSYGQGSFVSQETQLAIQVSASSGRHFQETSVTKIREISKRNSTSNFQVSSSKQNVKNKFLRCGLDNSSLSKPHVIRPGELVSWSRSAGDPSRVDAPANSHSCTCSAEGPTAPAPFDLAALGMALNLGNQANQGRNVKAL